MRLTTRILILMVVAATLAAAANTVLPGRIPWVEESDGHSDDMVKSQGFAVLTSADMKRILGCNTHVLIDARPSADFDAGHLPGAIPLPREDVVELFPQVQLLCAKDNPVVVYCSGGSCDDALVIARFLRSHGYSDVSLYADGFAKWRSQGLSVEAGP